MPVIPSWFAAGLAALWLTLVAYRLVVAAQLARRENARQVQTVLTATEALVDAPLTPAEKQIHAAGLDWNVHQLRGAMAITGIGALGCGLALNLPLVLLAAAAGAGAYGPLWYVGFRSHRREQEIESDLATGLTRMAALFKIQPDLAQVLRMTADSLSVGGESVLAETLRRTAAEIGTRGAEAALRDLERGTTSITLANVAVALRIYATAGGEFTTVMAESAERTRRLLEGRRHATAKAAEAATAARILPFLLLGVGIFSAQDPAFLEFYRSLTGQVILVVVIGLMAYGQVFMRKVIEEVV